MAKFPMMPFWTDAYLGDTTHLTTLEHGAYFLLLITAWRSKDGTLPDDDVMLSRYCRLSLDKWKKIRPIIQQFFQIQDGRWMQDRLQDEFKANLNFSKSQSKKAKTRHLKNKETYDAAAQSGICPADASPSPSPSPTKNPQTPKPDAQRKNISKKIKGVLKESGLGRGYKVEDLLSDDAWQDARSHAPGWCIHSLGEIYDAGINSGEREPPTNPNKAFPMWCKAYTKGKRP